MLDSIVRLGEAIGGGLDVLLDKVENVENVIGIIFDDTKFEYVETKLFKFTNNNDLLYRADKSGKPGIFLTGRIHFIDVDKLQKNIKNNETDEIRDFARKKILWFLKGKLLSHEFFNTIPKDVQDKIKSIMSELQSKTEIIDDVIRILNSDKPETILLTIMIKEKNQEKFVGQIKEFSDLCRNLVLEKKTGNNSQQLVCITCNQTKPDIEAWKLNPLPFFSSNKPMFFPDGSFENVNKGFPVCDDCYIEMQQGWRFINENLNFSIPLPGSKNPVLNFWLIPQLNDQRLMKMFSTSLSKKNLYLKTMKELCEKIDTVSTWDKGDTGLNSFLRFSTMFYVKDSHNTIQPLTNIPGIYPQRLEEILQIKKIVDDEFPFDELSKQIKGEFKFGFPVLAEIYQESSAQGLDQLMKTLTKIFKDEIVNIDGIIKIINKKIEQDGFKQRDLSQIILLSFRYWQVIESLIRLNHQTHQVQNMTKTQPNDRNSLAYEKLIKENALLESPTSRAIFAIGVEVGVLLHVQENRAGARGQPFWNKLNRLDLNLDKVQEFPSQVMTLLHQYGNREYDSFIEFLNTDMMQLDPKSDIEKSSINYVFTLGLSSGKMIAAGNLK